MSFAPELIMSNNKLIAFPIPELTDWSQLGFDESSFYNEELSPFVQDVERLIDRLELTDRHKARFTRHEAAAFFLQAFAQWEILTPRLEMILQGQLRQEDDDLKSIDHWLKIWWNALCSWGDKSLVAKLPPMMDLDELLETVPTRTIMAWDLEPQLQIAIWGELVSPPDDGEDDAEDVPF